MNQVPGSGLLDVNTQPVWYEAGTSRKAVFSVTNSKLIGTFTVESEVSKISIKYFDLNVFINS